MMFGMIYNIPDDEPSFVIVNEYGEYVSKITSNKIYLSSDIEDAICFWYDSAAQEMALELQAVTDKWFGVEEL